MKTTIFRSFLVLLFVACLQACTKDVTEKMDLKTQNQLVLVSFISPQDTLLTVSIQRTQPAIGRQFTDTELKVTDADVRLAEGGKTIQLLYKFERNVYEAKTTLFPIAAGKTYTLNVSTPNGWKASASSTVPEINNIAITSYQLKSVDDDYRGIKHTLSFKWQDAAGIDNYYRPLPHRETIGPVNSTKMPTKELFTPKLSADQFSTDHLQNGQELSSSDYFLYSQNPDDFPHPYNLHLSLLVTDKHYYLYNRSVVKQGDDEGNPFAEPALLYTNVAGGIGVFASYNLIKEIREVK